MKPKPHSPEPWKCKTLKHSGTQADYNIVLDADGSDVIWADGGMYDGWYPDIKDEDAHRIVACVNACRGIETEVLIAKAADPTYSVGEWQHSKNEED